MSLQLSEEPQTVCHGPDRTSGTSTTVMRAKKHDCRLCVPAIVFAIDTRYI